MEIGLIGFGRFGRLTVKYLARDFPVYVSSRTAHPDQIKTLKAIPASLEEVCTKDIVIPTVPISYFEAMVKKIAPLITATLFVDACSVKEFPVEVMKKYLPDSVQILATHPMFGPDSAAESLEGQKIVLSKIRMEDELYDQIGAYLKKIGLSVIETTPENHDRQIAKSQLITHLIGRGLSEFGAEPLEIDTEGYKRLLTILEVVGHDTEQLFIDMNKYNRFAKEVRQSFINALQQIDREVE